MAADEPPLVSVGELFPNAADGPTPLACEELPPLPFDELGAVPSAAAASVAKVALLVWRALCLLVASFTSSSRSSRVQRCGLPLGRAGSYRTICWVPSVPTVR